MPKVHTLKARKDIYKQGKLIDDPKTKSGKRLNRSQPRDEHDKVIVTAGQTYYKWTFYKSRPIISTTRPKYSQLTRSEHYQRLRQINERMQEFTAENTSDIETFIEEILDEANQFLDETQEKFDNVQEHFEGGNTYELLEQRVIDIEEFINELESFSIDEDSDLQDLISSINYTSIEEN